MAEAARDVLLSWLRKRGRIMLAGNREYFDGIDYVPPSEFIKFGGDSMTNKEEYRHQINEQEASELLLAYWRGKATLFGGKELATEEDVAAFVQAWERSSGA